jgi:hypothetical protein
MASGDLVAIHLHEDKSITHLIGAYLISILGAVLAIGLAFTVMFLQPLDLQFLVLSPLVQEFAKPVGVLWVLERRPLWFHRRWHVVAASLVAAAAFAVMESGAWVWFKHMDGYTLAHFRGWRCASSMVMHVVAFAVLSIGLAMSYRPGHKHGLLEIRKLLPFYTAAVVIHVGVNLVLRYLATLRILDPNYL